jgi:hypothetical protein
MGAQEMTPSEFDDVKLGIVCLGVCIAQLLRASDPSLPKKLKLLTREMSEHLKGTGAPHAADILYAFGSSLVDPKFFPKD